MLYSACLFSPSRKLNKIPCYRKRALSPSFPFEGAICPIKPFFSPWWLFFVKDADVQSVQTELKNWGWTWTSRRLIVRVMLVQLEQTLKAAGQLQMDFISSQPLHATLLPMPYLSLPRPSVYYIFFQQFSFSFPIFFCTARYILWLFLLWQEKCFILPYCLLNRRKTTDSRTPKSSPSFHSSSLHFFPVEKGRAERNGECESKITL